jgi:hypothetical protein
MLQRYLLWQGSEMLLERHKRRLLQLGAGMLPGCHQW